MTFDAVLLAAEPPHALGHRGETRAQRGERRVSAAPWTSRPPHKLTSLKQRLLANGWLTSKQITAQLGVGRTTIGRWRTEGRIKARICNDGGEWLYWPAERPLDEHAVDPDVSAAATGDNPTARGAL